MCVCVHGVCARPPSAFPSGCFPLPCFPVVPWSRGLLAPCGFPLLPRYLCSGNAAPSAHCPQPTALRAPHNTRPSWETRARGPLCWVPLWEKHKQRWAPRSLRPCVRGVRPFFGRPPLTVGWSLSAPLSVRAWSAVRCLSRLVSLCVFVSFYRAPSPAVYLGSGVSGCLRPLFCAGVCAGVQKRVFWDSLSCSYPIARSALSLPFSCLVGLCASFISALVSPPAADRVRWISSIILSCCALFCSSLPFLFCSFFGLAFACLLPLSFLLSLVPLLPCSPPLSSPIYNVILS